MKAEFIFARLGEGGLFLTGVWPHHEMTNPFSAQSERFPDFANILPKEFKTRIFFPSFFNCSKAQSGIACLPLLASISTTFRFQCFSFGPSLPTLILVLCVSGPRKHFHLFPNKMPALDYSSTETLGAPERLV